MKLIIFSIIFSFVGVSLSSKLPAEISEISLRSNFPQNALEDFIKGILDGILNDLPDPVNVTDLSINIDEPGLKLDLDLSEFKLNGLSKINLTEVRAEIVLPILPLKGRFNVTLKISEISLSGDYLTKGLIGYLFPIHGDGNFTVAIKEIDLVLGGFLTTRLIPTHLTITELFYNVKFGGFDVQLEGFLGGGEAGQAIIDLINNFGLQILVAGEAAIHDYLIAILEDALRDIPIGGLLEQLG